ncbi:MAG TPA: sigma-70 family RNA polymerase sigma factor [Polyangiaceae bacterium]
MLDQSFVAAEGEQHHGFGGGSEWRCRPRPEPDLRALYARYLPSIIAHCARFLRDSAAAEDAAHEVFLRAWRHAPTLPDSAEIRPWLFRVATNYCLNQLRARDVRARSLVSLSYTQPQHSEESLLARGDARRFLERLPPRARAVAWLTFVDGMLQKEVAAMLGVSRRTVVNHLSQVRACMKEESPPPGTP